MASKISATSGHDLTANTSPDDMLDCFITDLESGQDAFTLQAPPASSIPTTTLSEESLVSVQVAVGRGHQEDEDQRTSVHPPSTTIPSSEYSSSIYSNRSSALADTESGQTTTSSFPADEILTPRPLNLSRVTGASADECRNAVATDTGSGLDDRHESIAATFLDSQRPRSAVESHTSSDGDSEALIKEIVKHPIAVTSPTHGLNQTTSRLGHTVVKQKAARLLGLDGAGSPITPTTPITHEVMRDVINKEPMSSPRTLRNIASKLSLSGRKKPSQQEREASALAKIEEQAPLKLSKMVEEANRLPEASGSMSRRRGFRPLSIHTGKAFDPFGFGASLKPDLKSAKPSENSPKVIEADFATLISSTPPNIKHHPAFQSDPFTAKSPSPLLKTASSPLQIRERRDRMTPGNSSSNGSSGESMVSNGGTKKGFLFENGPRVAKNGDGKDPLDLMIGGSPQPRNRPFAPSGESLSTTLLQSSGTRTSASSDLSAAPLDSTRRNRGISSWFRQRDRSTERKSSDASRNSDGGAAREAQVGYALQDYV